MQAGCFAVGWVKPVLRLSDGQSEPIISNFPSGDICRFSGMVVVFFYVSKNNL
ncbi:MAG: hypothetical protein HW406_1129 [Candidatus Brocadiaceae bacterium]|nr:hypothetical protein [Candidatus Brocadiaceae bacterium]